MKETRSIADRGGKHHGPAHGPPGTRVYRLEGVGRTVRRGEEMPEARAARKMFKGGSDPGLCAPAPPQTRFVPIVSSGVAPALEELRLVMGIP